MKKIKLFLSLCMMCLSVAVLCMGILAASSATYNINGNISYNMIDGIALVNTRVYKVADTTNATDISSKSFEEIERDTSTYYILSQKLDSQPLINTSSGETSSSSTTSVDIVYGAVDSGVEYYTYYVVIQIRNTSTDTNYVLNAYLETVTTPKKSSVSINATSDSVISIASGEYKNVIVALTYNGTSTDKDEDTFSYTLNLTYALGWVERTFYGTYGETTYSVTLSCCQGKTWSQIYYKKYGNNQLVTPLGNENANTIYGIVAYGTPGNVNETNKVAPDDHYDSANNYALFVYVGTGGGSK